MGQMSVTVAFQGERGAFSEAAARKLLGDSIEVLPRRSFEDVFDAVTSRAATAAVVPVENSLAGIGPSHVRSPRARASRDRGGGAAPHPSTT